MAGVLVYAEGRDGAFRTVAGEVSSAARRLADELEGEVHALAVGGPGLVDAANSLERFGVDRVFALEAPEYAHYSPDAAVRAIQTLEERHSYVAILFPASAQGKDLSPRVAARLGKGLATEVTEIELVGGSPVVTRPQFGGKVYARIRFTEAPALMSLRPNIFHAEERSGAVVVESLDLPFEPARTVVRGIERGERTTLDVSEANVVVSGGRGMQDPGNWHLLEDLVDALGDEATLGASRAVVDAGWRPHDEQVGQTGKVVSPDLYFAVGISGAIQHLAGMRTAKVIVAVNRDADAPIFGVANYGIVGDVFEVLPRLAEEVRKLRSEGR